MRRRSDLAGLRLSFSCLQQVLLIPGVVSDPDSIEPAKDSATENLSRGALRYRRGSNDKILRGVVQPGIEDMDIARLQDRPALGIDERNHHDACLPRRGKRCAAGRTKAFLRGS